MNGLGTLVNGQPSGVLLTDNPNNTNPANAPNQTNPFRLDRSQASTCDQGHNYGAEQAAFDQGLMDAFPLNTGAGGSSFCAPQFAYGKNKGLVMGYFDGNAVTALWNYAQNFATNDNSYGTTFGPSTPGLANLVAGNTYPATPTGPTNKVVPTGAVPGTLVGDLDPTGDVCSTRVPTVELSGKNIGDLLNAKGVSWGAFMGGFDLTAINANGTSGCSRSSAATPANGGPTADYIPHHAFFQYWSSTANPAHTRPASLNEIGHAGPANHQYDLHDFFDALKAGKLPAVSFVKAIAAGEGHAGYSDPLLEQSLTLVPTINAIMNSPFWNSTAIIAMYDDSDGWYDHQMSPIVNSSAENSGSVSTSDELNGPGKCGNGPPLSDDDGADRGALRLRHAPAARVYLAFAKRNFVDHALTDQSSVLRFIEDNWGTGQIGGGSFDQIAGPLTNMFDFDGHGDHGDDHGDGDRRLILDPATGEAL